MTEIMPVSKRTRYEVLKRDNHTCRYCGQCAPEVKITLDHVVPITLGGSDDPSNLVAACVDCNAGKSSTVPDAPLVDDVQQQAIRWSAAMKLAADRLAKRDEPLRAYVCQVEDELETYRMDSPRNDYCFDVPIAWRDTAAQFYRAGLTADQFVYALTVAVSKQHISGRNVWRYACGVAWSMVREMQAEAQKILEEGGV